MVLEDFDVMHTHAPHCRVRLAALRRLMSLLRREDCHLESLCVDDSKLKEQTSLLLNALDDNNSLRKLNIG